MSMWGGLKRGRVYVVLIPMLLTGIADVVFGLTSLLFVAAVAALTFSVMSPLLNAHSQTIWQTLTNQPLKPKAPTLSRISTRKRRGGLRILQSD
jgi:hypothetical protein